MTRYQEAGGVGYYTSKLLSGFAELAHGFFTRRGGSSRPPYDSLNLSFGVGDHGPTVQANRSLVQEVLGLAALTSATQVHGQQAVIIEDYTRLDAELPAADILITQRPGVGLLIKQADCQAVMLYDPRRRVAANVHCGWRGQVQNILAAAVARLQEVFGVYPADLVAAIGPGLGPCCAEFRRFREEFPPALWAYQVRPAYFDLWRLSHDQLRDAGLLPQNIDILGLCSRCRGEDFFSYRREGITGRQGAVLAVRP
jgi:YfiH family protein